MKFKILTKYLILPVLILLGTETFQAQTVIRENVKINPQETTENLTETQVNDSLKIIIMTAAEFSIVVENTCGEVYSSPWLNQVYYEMNIPNPTVGDYTVHLNLKINQGALITADCVVIFGDHHYNDGGYIIGGNGEVTVHDYNFSIHYNNDFEIEKGGGFIVACGEINAISISVKRFEEVADCSKNISLDREPHLINLSIQSLTNDIVFWDNASNMSLGRTTTIGAWRGASVGIR